MVFPKPSGLLRDAWSPASCNRFLVMGGFSIYQPRVSQGYARVRSDTSPVLELVLSQEAWLAPRLSSVAVAAEVEAQLWQYL
jgi:hypothetical protein